MMIAAPATGCPDPWSVTLPLIVPANRAASAPMNVPCGAAVVARGGPEPNASGNRTAGSSEKCMVFLLGAMGKRWTDVPRDAVFARVARFDPERTFTRAEHRQAAPSSREPWRTATTGVA